MLGIGGHVAVLAVTSEQSLPDELPPACAEWQRIPLSQLAAVLSVGVSVYLHPEGVVLPPEQLEQLSGRHLVHAAERVREGQCSLGELRADFLASTVYCLATDQPGTTAYEVDGRRTIPVFSSLLSLARTVGDAAWSATTGRDLVAQVPEGFDLQLDPGASYSITLREPEG